MKPISGLNRDISVFNQPENTYRYANNAIVSETLGNLESIRLDLDLGSFPVDFLFMGWHVVDKTVLAVGVIEITPPADPIAGTYEGVIYELTPDLYVPVEILRDPLDVWELGKDIDVVSGLPLAEFQFAWSKDAAGRRQFVWAPIKTQPKFINVDRLLEDVVNVPAGVIDGLIYTRKAFLLFPEAYLPSPSITVQEDGGNVDSGAYFIAHKYEYIDGSSTDWSAFSNQAYVIADTASSSEDGFNLYGDEGSKRSPKSIKILIDVDDDQPPDSFVRISYISYRGGVVFAGILNRISLNSIISNGGVVWYTGENPEIDLGDDISELITPKAHYRKAGTITSLTNRLYIGNLTEANNLIYQGIANLATISWKVSPNPPDTGNNSVENKSLQVKVPTFGPGEVYAFYMHFLKKDGTESRAFHIPGRKWGTGSVAAPEVPSAKAVGTVVIEAPVPTIVGIMTLTRTGMPGSVDVPIVANDTVPNILNKTRDAIEFNIGSFRADSVDDNIDTVTITDLVDGVIGNTLLTASNTAGLIVTVSGMSGGANFTEAILEDTDPKSIGSESFPFYQVDDTTLIVGPNDGVMGYWANQDEYYPSFDDFQNLTDGATDPSAPAEYINRVRHHRFPTLRWLYDNADLGTEPYRSNIFLEIDVSLVDIPEELSDEIDGVYISYAKKPVGDTINVGTQMTIPQGLLENADGVMKPTGGPWNITTGTNDLSVSGFVYRWHGLNLLQNFTAVTPKYVQVIRSFYSAGLESFWGASELYWPIDAADPEDPMDRINHVSAYKYGFVDFLKTFVSAEEYSIAQEQFLVKEYSYIRNGSKISLGDFSVDNMVGEDCLLVSLEDEMPIVKNDFFKSGLYSWIFASLHTVPENIAHPFTNQTLIYSLFGRVVGPGPLLLSGGSNSADFFNGYMQYNATAPVDGDTNTTTDEAGQFRGEGTKIAYTSYSVSPFNLSTQFFNSGEFNSYIYPIQGNVGVTESNTIIFPESIEKAKTWYFWDQNIYQVQNKYYNNDFNRLREFFIQDIYDGVVTTNNEFPVTIAFSLQQLADSPIANWRTWLVNNRYTQPVYPGDIINLEGAGNQKLYIHHRYSLFITKDRTTLKGSVDVTLGSSDIFEVVPFEIITTDEGHTGLGRREWTDMNVMGYVWANADHGKIYLHDGEKLEELSSNGMRIFFREFMDKNSAFGSSFNFVYDEDRKRLLLSAFGADTEQRFNLSYSAMGGFWVSFYDEFNFNAIATRDKTVLFRKYTPGTVNIDTITPGGVNPLDVYAVAKGEYGSYDQIPFIIEVVANQDDVTSKYLKAILWSTNLIDQNDVDVADDTFSKLFIYTDTKTSGEIALVPYTGFPKPGQNMRRLENNWMMNQFRNLWDGITPIILPTIANRLGPNIAAADPLLPWFGKGRMRDRAFIIRLTYDKVSTNKFVLSSIYFDFKQSIR